MDRRQNNLTLEALEPRILLSGEALQGCTPDPAEDLLHSVEFSEAAEDSSSLSSDIHYNPAQQVDGMFDGIAGDSNDAAQDPAPAPGSDSDEGSETETESEAAGDASGVSNPLDLSLEPGPAPAVSQLAGATMVNQLTESLNNANGPPAAGNYLHLTPESASLISTAIVLNTGDTLTGTGALSVGIVNNHGLLNAGNSPGTMSMPTFSQGPDGITIVEIGGTSQGVSYDWYDIAGLAEFDGTLQIEIITPFVPSLGQTFQVFTFGSHAGEFANYLGTAAIPGSPELAFLPIYNSGDLTLEVIATPTVLGSVQTEIDNGLAFVDQIGTLLDSAGNFAANLPLIGSSLGGLTGIGTAISNAVRAQVNALLAPVPTQAEVTAGIEAWNGTTVAGFTITVNGVLGHYGTAAADPFWYDVDLTLTPAAVNVALADITGAVLDAVFSPAPMVQVNAAIDLDFSFGLDGAVFFVEVDEIKASASVDVSGLSGFGISLMTPAGPQSLAVIDGGVELEASVTATPDPSVLTSGRILETTLNDISTSTINVEDAFNFEEAGSVSAFLTLGATLSGWAAINYSGTHTVRIESTELFSGNDPDLTVEIDGSLEVLGQTLSGVFTLKKTATETVIEAENVSFELNAGFGAGAKRFISATNGTAQFVLLGDDIAGTASLTIDQGPDIPNLSIAGTTLSLALNTSSSAVPTIDGDTVDLPAGPYYRVEGNAVLSLATPAVDLTADFLFEPFDPTPALPNSGDEVVTVAVTNLEFDFDDGTAAVVNLSNGEGTFVFTTDGVVGEATGDLDIALPGVTLISAFALEINDTNAAYAATVDVNGFSVAIDVAAGEFVRVEAAGAELTILGGLIVRGDFVFEEKKTDTGMEDVITVGANNLEVELNTASSTLVDATNGSGAFILTSNGIAGEATIDITLAVTGISLTGTFSLRINDTETAVDEMVDVVGTLVHIDVPEGPYLQINATGAVLTVLGISMSGDFSLEQRETEDGTQLITVVAQNVSFDFSAVLGSLLSMENGEALFIFTDTGAAGAGMIDVGLNVFGQTYTNPFNFAFNNTELAIDEVVDWEGDLKILDLGPGPAIQVAAEGIDIAFDVAGQTQTLTGDFVFSQIDDEGDKYVTIGASNVSTTLGAGLVTLAVTGGTGAFVLNDDGIAGRATIETATLAGVPLVSLVPIVEVTVMGAEIEFNNTGADVGPIDVAVSSDPADDVTVEFTGAYYHDYFAVSGLALVDLTGPVTVGLVGHFTFEVSDTDPDLLKIGVEDLSFDLKASFGPDETTVLSLHNGSGAFVISDDGIAGIADVEFEVGIIGVSGDVDLEVNTTTSAVTASVNTAAGITNINLTDTEYLQVCVNGNLLISSFSLPFNFNVLVDTVTGSIEFREKGSDILLVSVAPDGSISTGLSLNDFAQPGPFEFVGLLRQIAGWLSLVAEAEIFNVKIPFTQVTIGDALDWSQVFLDEIYSHMTSVELQSRSLTTSSSGSLVNKKFKLVVGTDAAVEVTVNGAYSDLDDLALLFNAGLAAAGLGTKVTARTNQDDQFVLALLPAEAAHHSTLHLVNADSGIVGLGFGPDDGDPATTDQVAVETARYSTEEFFVELGDLLGLTVVYNQAQQVYTYTVNEGATFNLPVPFAFGAELGDIAAAELSGELNIAATVGFGFTIGFDLGAGEVPRILSSSLIPAPSNGRLSADATFDLFLNDDLGGLTLTLPKSWTDGTDAVYDIGDPNDSLEDLAKDFNRLFSLNSYGGEDLDEILYAQKAGSGLAISALNEDNDDDGLLGFVDEDDNGNKRLDDGEDDDNDGVLDRVEDLNGNGTLENQLGVINLITIRAKQDNPFSTELGFGVEALDLDDNPATTNDQYFVSTSKSTIKGVFLEDVSLSASLTVTTTTPIAGSARFVFVDVSTSGGVVGTVGYDGVTPAPIQTTISLQDQNTGNTRFYASELFGGLASTEIGDLIAGPTFTGSFLARLDNIAVLGGLINLGPNPEFSVWVPDITDLDYNPDPYDGSNTGIFLTYPDLGHLNSFSKVSFTDVIQALNAVADSLSDLAAFSFLDTKLPFIDISINDMLDYAAQFADLIEAASGAGSESLQDMLAELEDQIELLFDLDPGILNVTLDDNGIASDPVTTGGVDGVSQASATYDPNGSNNGILFTSTDLANASSFNGVTVRFQGSHDITDDSAIAEWDETNSILTILINGGVTTATSVVAAVAAIDDTPWLATLMTGGDGTYTTTALKFSFVFSTGYADSLPFQLDLGALLNQLAGDNTNAAAFLDAVTGFIQIQGSGVLTVSAGASLTLDFGLDLTDPCDIRPFFYDTTGVELTAKVLGTEIEFEASLNSILGIFIKDGMITLDADGDPDTDASDGDKGARFRLGLNDNNGDGRHYFNENWFNSDSIDLTLEGGISATLPIFAPTEVIALGGDTDENGDGYPDNYLAINIPDLVRLFIADRASGSDATLAFGGLNNDIQVTSTTESDYKVKLQNDPDLAGAANASFSGDTLLVVFDSGMTTASTAVAAIQGVTGFAGTQLTADDDGVLATTTNNGSGFLNKITIVTPDFGEIFANIDVCDLIDSSVGPLLDGLDSLLLSIQEGLNEIVMNTRLPLVGNGLGKAANFIEDFRTGLLANLRQAIDDAGGSAITALENAIKDAFWNTLGPGGLGLLVNADDASELDESLGSGQLDVTLDCDTGLVVRLRLAKSIDLVDTSGNPINLDLGVPGFGLSVDGNVLVSLGFDLKFGFGLNKEDGFYFDSSAGMDDPELRIYFEVTIPGLAAKASLLFLQLDVNDDPDDPSFFIGQFTVDLMDPNNDGKLTFAEITSSGTQFGDIIAANLEATADVNLEFAASFGGNTAFPRVVGMITLDWHWDIHNGAEKPQLAVKNLALDLGTFISDFLGPILTEIRKVTEPLQPIIDVATARLPVISDLAGRDITLIDLAAIFGLLEPSTVKFIQNVISIIELINKIGGLGEGSILIPFGSMALNPDENGGMTDLSALEAMAQADIDKAIDAATGPGVSETYKMKSAEFAGDLGSLDNFSIPIFDNPTELFNLFTGDPVRLVEWRMPTFLFQFEYVQKIPIYPPLYAQFGGRIGAKIDIGFGYDTFGIQKFIASEDKNVLDILDGFYVIDFDENGNERAELTLTGELFAGASIDLFIVEAGVRGGIFAIVEFDLNDINNDGRVRVSEIIANAKQDPRCIFNIHGEIGLFLEAFLIVDLFFFSIDKTWRFAEITLFEFSVTCPVPILGSQPAPDSGTLTIHAGQNAADREEIDTSDNNETFVIAHVDGTAGNETVEVRWGDYTEEFSGVTDIVVDGGNGNDFIDLRGVHSPATVTGGPGNDTIYLPNGNGSTADGEEGNDIIIAGTGTGVILWGGAGQDILTAAGVAIEIHGGSGKDTITGSNQGDDLFGDEEADTIVGNGGDDMIDGGDGNDIIDGNDGDDILLGGAGNDTIRGSRGNDTVNGNDGDDSISGGAGNDILAGGNGSDQIYGHGGTDLLIGDDYASIVGSVNDIATNGITVLGLTGSGKDFLVGGGDSDVIFGGDGDDALYGGNFFQPGETQAIVEDHNDFLDGGLGNDILFGDDAMGRTGDRNTGIAIVAAIFYDNNLDGVKNDDETGFGGVVVELRKQSDSSLISTEITNSTGIFEFVGLDPNNYYLVFSLPPGLSFAAMNAGGAATPDESSSDSDVNPGTGETNQFAVGFDETEIAVTAGYTGAPLLSVDDISVTEGNSGQTEARFTLHLSGPSASTLFIPYTTINSAASATAGDFDAVSGVLVLHPGETQAVITVPVNGDVTYETHEQFILSLTNPFGGPNLQPLATIINDDRIPTISIRDAVPAEGALETDAAVFVLVLSNPSQDQITVDWRTDAALNFQALDATNAAIPSPLPGGDYLQDFNTVVFEPGETTQFITVLHVDDTLDEHDEHYYVDIFNATYALLDDDRAYGIIADDDDPVSVTIAPVFPKFGAPFTTEVTEDNSFSVFVPVEVTLSAPSGKTITVTYATSPGTAVESVFSQDIIDGINFPDYQVIPDSSGSDPNLVFLPGGPLTQTILLEVFPDHLVEGTEEFFINLISADHAEIAAVPVVESNHVVIEILDDDGVSGVDHGPWSIRFSDSQYFVEEPAVGTATAEITLLRTPGSSNAIAVFYTLDGTATAGLDYDPVFRHLVYFAENEWSRKVPITIFSDLIAEGPETIRLFLRNPTGGPTKAFPNQAILTIHDEDTPTLSTEAHPILGTQTELNPLPGSVSVRFNINLSAPSTANVTVDYETVQLTAREGTDYMPVSGSTTLLAGSTQAFIDVLVLNDLLAELTETFAFRISIDNDQPALLAPNDSVAIGTIHDDDLKAIEGTVFFDRNGNGFKDLSEGGIGGVDVTVQWIQNGSPQSITVQTNPAGLYTTSVALGQVNITVDGSTITSPIQGPAVSGSGEYELTSGNDTQTVDFLGAVGITPFSDVGYNSSTSTTTPGGSTDVGRGGTDDTVFGGPGNDTIDAGAGDDHVVGGHWMNATDSHAPIHLGTYDAYVEATTNPPDALHVVYDQGPIFSVDTSGLPTGGSISGVIWLDTNGNHIRDEALFTADEVVIHLYDEAANHVNSVVTTNGTYIFTGLFLDAAPNNYVIEFALPDGYAFVSPNVGPATTDSDPISGGRTMKLGVSIGAPAVVNIDAGLRPADATPTSGSGDFEFDDPSFSASENDGFVTVTVVRGDSSERRVVLVRTSPGSAAPGVNYTAVSALLTFNVGETFKSVDIPIIDSNTLGFCDTLHFNLELRDPTGRHLSDAIVYIYGDGAGTLTDDDIINGGGDWDIILGDSGNIAANVVIATPATLLTIVYSGGPGDDIIHGGNGPDFIHGQLGDDILAGNEGQDQVKGGLGDDLILAELDDDTIDGEHGFDTVFSNRDVPIIELSTTGPGTADLIHRDTDGDPLSTFSLTGIEMARLFGGFRGNIFDIRGWDGSAIIYGATGHDSLLVSGDTDMTLVDASLVEAQLFLAQHGFLKDGSVSFPSEVTYHFGSIENVKLTGGAGNNLLNASAYSKPVTFEGLGGDDILIGGPAADTFLFEADAPLGTDIIAGNAGTDTIDFGPTTTDVELDLSLLGPATQTVNSFLGLILIDLIENATGGSGDDTLTGNALNNVLTGGPGSDTLAGKAGSEVYVFDTDTPWGDETVIEDIADAGHDIINFSGTTTLAVSLNLSILGSLQVVNVNLGLTIIGEGVEEVIGGTRNDTLRGNSNNNVLRGGPGNDILDGKSGNDTLDGGSGNDDLNGGLGTDTIAETANTNFTLSNSRLIWGGETDTLSGIEIAHLRGGSLANTFNLTGWTGSGSLHGGDSPSMPRLDTLIVNVNADVVLTDGSLDISTSTGLVALAGIDIARITTGAGDNLIDAAGFSGTTVLSGGDGDDTIIGGSGTDTIRGGLGNDTVTGNQSNDNLDGGAGINHLIETRSSAATAFLAHNAFLFIIEDPFSISPGFEFDSITSFQTVELTGSAFDDSFNISGWTTGTVTLHGGAGTNSVVLTMTLAPGATTGKMVTLTDATITFTGGAGTIVLDSINAATITGTSLGDTLDASAFTGDATLRGGAGNDILISGEGNDTLLGQAGDDTFVFLEESAPDTDRVEGGSGIDTLDFSGFTSGISIDLGDLGSTQAVVPGELELVLPNVDIENVIGGSGADIITGNALNNTFTGGAGADTIDGFLGVNRILETADSDFILSDFSLDIGGTADTLQNISAATLTGGAGDNTLDAAAFSGNTILRGLEGNDTIRGGLGSDLIEGGADDDMLIGNDGSDVYFFDVDEALGQDTIVESAAGIGNDIINFAMTTSEMVSIDLSDTAQQAVHATNLQLTLSSSTGIESVIGGDQDDVLTGNALNNNFIGGLGADTISGNGGTLNLLLEVRDADFILTDTSLDIDGVVDTLSGIQRASLAGGAGNNTIDASAFTLGNVGLSGGDGSDILIGGEGADLIFGGNGNDSLFGNEGTDTLIGDAGHDTLNGGADDDGLIGGLGNDTYVFDQSFDQGTDTVYEDPFEGFSDTLVGAGLGGIAIDLFLPGLQIISANLSIILANPGEVEFSF